jgi:hypothetical protein
MKKYFIFLIIGLVLLVGGPKYLVACDDNTCNKTETRTLSCDTGYTGSITETRHQSKDRFECKWSDWEETSNTCVIETYTYTVNKDGTGDGTVSGGGTYNYGTTAYADAYADKNSTFTGWSGDCNAIGSVVMDGPKTCTATFTKDEEPVETFTVIGTAGANGTITPASQEAGSGTTVNFTVTPSVGYIATVGGTCPVGTSVGTLYTTGNITADCAVEASFALAPVDNYTVTASAGANGTITPASQEAGSGTTVNFTVTPNSGYTATVAGTCPVGTSVGTLYTTGNITADCAVEATFTKIPLNSFVLTVETPGTGSGVVTGAGTYTSGTVVTLTATPNDDSTFEGWSENCPGGVVTLTGNTTCTATFTLKAVEKDACPNLDDVQTTVPSGYYLNSHGNCARRSGGGSGSTPKLTTPGQVLGATTTCGIYVDKYMRMGLKGNNAEAVRKVQIFLNDYMGSGLVVDGVFGPKTDTAVRAFQAKQFGKVLAPWGLTGPTGIFYLTTQTEVNNIMCPPLNLPIPALVPINQNPSFPQY